MGMNKPDIHNDIQLHRTAGLFDEFNEYTDTQLWTKAGAGTVVNSDGDGGLMTLTTGAVQDQEAVLATTRKLWTFKAGAPLIFQIALNYTEALVNKAGIFAGFASTFTDVLVDATYVLATPLSAVGVFKKPGDTFWSAFTSVGATQLSTLSKSSCLQPGLTQEIIVQVMIVGSNLEATFSAGAMGPATITGGGAGGLTWLYPTNAGPAFQPIKHVIPFAGAVAMSCGASIKAGSASSEVMLVDYIGAEYLARP